ncbi:MAG: 1-deoxy-D-xylulose-5-phosphate reductoisomerase [Spirochaetes bacterium]|nr:1-deoxy-D-xylulose-5-phosphate reductoisomerase [Spirochaetota bacterium]
MKKTLAILGSTGSIGTSALNVVNEFKDEISVKAISCNNNIDLFCSQIREYRPEIAVITDAGLSGSTKLQEIKDSFPGTEILCGKKFLNDLADRDYDILLSAIVGSAGLEPTIRAIPNVKRIALANKETLVVSGEFFKSEIQKYNRELIPVDSEHSAIFSLLDKENRDNLNKIIITASGGSLRDLSENEMEKVTPEIALKHPNWNMGSKITIDSSTLINKGLEVIEAHFLFNMNYDNIDVIIHPESIIHSMIEMNDGSVFAHMGVTDMVFPIMYSFFYPEKRKNSFGRLNFAETGSLTFREYDSSRFPGLELCYSAGREGGSMPAVLNAANEIAVNAFLKKEIKFTDIIKIIKKTMDTHETINISDIHTIYEIDLKARETAESILKEIK